MTAVDGRELVQESLPDWLRPLAIDLGGDVLALRSQNIARVAEGIDQDSLLDYVAVAFGVTPLEEFHSRLVQTLRLDDSAYPASGTEREIQLIVACALAQAIHEADERAPGISLAAQAAAFRGWETEGPNLQALGRQWLDQAGAHRRERAPGTVELPKPPTVPAAPKPNEDGEVSFDDAAIAAILATLKSAVAYTSSGLGDLNRRQEKRSRLQDEEVNVLWWLLGEESRDAQRPWSELEEGAIPLTAGRELAALIEQIPGPSGAFGFLRRVLRHAEHGREHQWSIAEAVEAATAASEPTEQWKPHSLLPITTSLSVYAAHTADKQWRASCKAQHGIDVSKKYAAERLALETYDELLLRRILGLDEAVHG